MIDIKRSTDLSIDSLENRKLINNIAYERAADILEKVASIYSSSILSPNYAVFQKIISEVNAEFEDGSYNLLNDYNIDHTRSDFLYQKHGYLAHFQDPLFFPTTKLELEWPHNSGEIVDLQFNYEDTLYRNFIKALYVELFKGAKSSSFLEGAKIFTDREVDILEYMKMYTSKASSDISRIHDWILFINLDETKLDLPLHVIIEGLNFLVKAKKPAETFATVGISFDQNIFRRGIDTLDMGATGELIAYDIILKTDSHLDLTQDIEYLQEITLTNFDSISITKPATDLSTIAIEHATTGLIYILEDDYEVTETTTGFTIARVSGSNIISGQTVSVKYKAKYVDGVTDQYSIQNIITNKITAGDIITELTVGSGTRIIINDGTRILTDTGELILPFDVNLQIGQTVYIYGHVELIPTANINKYGLIDTTEVQAGLTEKFAVETCSLDYEEMHKKKEDFTSQFTLTEDVSHYRNFSENFDTFFVKRGPLIIADSENELDWNGQSVTATVDSTPVSIFTIEPAARKIILEEPVGDGSVVEITYTYGTSQRYPLYTDLPEAKLDGGLVNTEFVSDNISQEGLIHTTRAVSGGSPFSNYENIITDHTSEFYPKWERAHVREPNLIGNKHFIEGDWNFEALNISLEHGNNTRGTIFQDYSKVVGEYFVESSGILGTRNITITVPTEQDLYDGMIVAQESDKTIDFEIADWAAVSPFIFSTTNDLAKVNIVIQVQELTDDGYIIRDDITTTFNTSTITIEVGDILDRFDGRILYSNSDETKTFNTADWTGSSPHTLSMDYTVDTSNIIFQISKLEAGIYTVKYQNEVKVSGGNIVVEVPGFVDLFNGKITLLCGSNTSRISRYSEVPRLINTQNCDNTEYFSVFNTISANAAFLTDRGKLRSDSTDILQGNVISHIDVDFSPEQIFGEARARFDLWSMRAIHSSPVPLIPFTQSIVQKITMAAERGTFLPSYSDLITNVNDTLNSMGMILNNARFEKAMDCIENLYAEVTGYLKMLNDTSLDSCKRALISNYETEMIIELEEEQLPLMNQVLTVSASS